MQINKHGSFYIRNGWPTKIIDAITQDSHIFSPNNELLAVDYIGVGRVMIKAMRYWAVVLGIATEHKDQQGISHTLTPLGKLIAEKDIYCIDRGSLWLLHRNLARNYDNATAWYWAFNCYTESEFVKKSFTDDFYSFLQRSGAKYARNPVEKEFDCFKNTYVSDQAFSLSKIIDEDTVPFFAPLGLLEYKGKGLFTKRKLPSSEVPEDILLYCLLADNEEHLRENRQVSISTMLDAPGQVGKYMNLSFSTLLELLQRLENNGHIRLVNNFGNRYIEIMHSDVDKILEDHYHRIGR